MALLYFTVFAQLLRLIEIIVKAAILIAVFLAVSKTIRRLTILLFYKHITRVAIYGKKDIIIRESVPMGYSENYYRVEHYKYIFKNVGVKYKTRVYFGDGFYLPYRFKDTDKVFQKLLVDSEIMFEELN